MFGICKKIGKYKFHHVHKDHSIISGQLSQQDIIREMDAGKLIITPLEKTEGNFYNIKGASFDISPSCLIMSVKRGRFLRIYSNINIFTYYYFHKSSLIVFIIINPIAITIQISAKLNIGK